MTYAQDSYPAGTLCFRQGTFGFVPIIPNTHSESLRKSVRIRSEYAHKQPYER